MSEARRYHEAGRAVTRLRAWVKRTRPIVGTARARLTAWREAEAGRLLLWSAPAFGFGALSYLAAASEPPVWLAVLGCAFAVAGLIGWRPAAGGAARAALLLFALFCAGHVVAALRAAAVSAPVISRETRAVSVKGWLIEREEEAAGGARYLIRVAEIEGIVSDQTPQRVRMRWRGRTPEADAAAGDLIELRGVLSPPPGPAAPRGFDYARQAWFERLGGVGYAYGAPDVLERDAAPGFGAQIESARARIAARVAARAPGDAGGVLAAMTTGKRGWVTDRAENALRDAGLAHLLAISGLHIGLVAGLVFAGVRFALAGVRDLALRWPIKKLAALAGIVATFAYLALSGGAWSARRAAVMAIVAFIAILFERRAISLRNVALAALIILITTPEAVVHAGFHMSFAATTALVAFYEWHRDRGGARAEGWRGRVGGYVAALALTSLVAGFATGPFAVFHFNRAAVYGLAGNLLAMPIIGLVTAPATLIGLLLAPVGLDGPFLALAGASMGWVLAIAEGVAATPGAVSHFATPPGWSLLAVIGGGLWLCLNRAAWRHFAWAPIALGVAGAQLPETPDTYISRSAENAALLIEMNDKRALYAWSVRKDRFALDTWVRRAGLSGRDDVVRPLSEIAQCDDAGCVAQVGGRAIAITDVAGSVFEDCRRADIVIALMTTPLEARDVCSARLIDRRSVAQSGAMAFTLSEPPGIPPRAQPRPWDVDAK